PQLVHLTRLHVPFIPFFFTAPSTTALYTLSLHDALPILTTITLMHWRTAYALLLPNMANRICYCSLIMAFPSVMQMKAMITRNVDRKSTRLNSSHVSISYAVFCLKKKRKKNKTPKQDHR